MTVVHVLVEGRPLCGFSLVVPGRWPDGHKWVRNSPNDIAVAGPEICGACLEARHAMSPTSRVAVATARAVIETKAAIARCYACPRCGITSYNPNDLTHRYCGRCHQFEA